MKKPNYVMCMMATGGALIADETCKMATQGMGRDKVHFRYTLPYDWHFRYRHAVDDHNNLCHSLPSLEDTWVTRSREIHVFAFLLAITEVNVYLVLRFFVYVGTMSAFLPNYIDFRRKLAWHMAESPTASSISEDHSIATAPNYASEYRNRRWICDATSKYPQYTCKWPGCKKLIRTYCSCTPGRWLCTSHIVSHAVEVTKEAYLTT